MARQEISPVRKRLNSMMGIFGIKADAWSAILLEKNEEYLEDEYARPDGCTDGDKPGAGSAAV